MSGTIEIPLTNGGIALVDEDDAYLVTTHRWHRCSKGYAKQARAPKLRMHQVIAQPAPGQQVDHVNRDKLDNRRENLRICTASQNQANHASAKNSKSGIKGVWWSARDKVWYSQIKCSGVRISLGSFSSAAAAARAYNATAAEWYGPFANLNEVP